jgi:mannan endo-1,6-alpha-mannosidase
LITHSQFIQQGARSYIITHDTNTLDQAKSILEWVISSGLANPDTGLLLDGTSTTDCKDFTTFQWSYNYGQWLGSLASMHKASQDQRYLDMAIPFLNYSQNTFAATNTSGIVAEICEADDSCNRDQKGFKAAYVRNLAYLHSETNNSIMKQVIEKIIDTTVRAMVSHSCDSDWNCAGIWTSDKRSVTKSVRAQHVSTALLVAALGIHAGTP